MVQVVGETIAAWRLADAKEWRQIFMDATSRRQCAFQALIVGLMDDTGKLDLVIVSSCIFLEDETSQTAFDSIVDKVRNCFDFITCFALLLILTITQPRCCSAF